MKKLIITNILTGLLVAFLIGSVAIAATVLKPSGGGTGTNTKPGKGSLLVGASSTAYGLLATSTNGYVLTSSSTATLGVAWQATTAGISSLNGSSSSTQTFATSTATNTFNIATANGVHTFTIPSNLGFFANDGLFVTSPVPYASTTGIQNIISFPLGYASTTGIQNTISFPISVASTSLGVTAPLSLLGNQLSMSTSTGLVNGYLSFVDWNTFNNKQSQLWGLSGSNLFASSTSWNVGIGTTTPAYKLDVIGDLRVNTSSTLGNVISGTWLGTAIGDTYISSATTWNAKQNAITFPIPVASTSLTVVSPLTLSTNALSMPTSTTAVSGFLLSGDWTTFNNKQSTISAGSNIVLTGASVAVTSTPAFTKIIYPDATTQTTAYKDFGVNVYNATSTPTATSTLQKQFFQAITISQLTCSTSGSDISITAERRASSTPETIGTSMLTAFVCGSTGNSTSSITSNTVPALGILNFNLISVPNSTTTLRIYGKYTEN